MQSPMLYVDTTYKWHWYHELTRWTGYSGRCPTASMKWDWLGPYLVGFWAINHVASSSVPLRFLWTVCHLVPWALAISQLCLHMSCMSAAHFISGGMRGGLCGACDGSNVACHQWWHSNRWFGAPGPWQSIGPYGDYKYDHIMNTDSLCL